MNFHTIDTSSGEVVRILADYLYSTGLDVSLWFKEIGIDPSELENPATRFSQNTILRAWNIALEKTENQNLGLEVGINHICMAGDVLTTIASNSPTIESALSNLCKYHGILSADPQPYLEYHEDRVSLCLESESPHCAGSKQILICMFAGILKLTRQLARENINPLAINYTWRDSLQNIQKQNKYFRTKFRFQNDRDELIFARGDIEKRIRFADTVFLQAIQTHAQHLLENLKTPATWSKKVEKILIGSIGYSGYDISTVSRKLFISIRYLQQKLKEENTSFQTTLDLTRKSIALEYLEKNKTSIADLALYLGFSEQSAFNHAFKRWTGKTPKEIRKF